jgi:hypothetical protein
MTMPLANTRRTSLLASLLDGVVARISTNKPLNAVSDESLVFALTSVATRLRRLDLSAGSMTTDTPETILAEAIAAGLRIGVNWWTGTDEIIGSYTDISDERMLKPRVLADLMPELTTRLYLCQTLGPGKPRKRIKATSS